MTWQIFDFDITFMRDRRRKSFWQWLLRRKCLNELYAMTPDEDGSDRHAMVGNLGADHKWNLPFCASRDQRNRDRDLNDGMNNPLWRSRPDYSNLTDEELAERMKTARLGEGVIAEYGVRQFRKGELREDAPGGTQ